MEYGKFNEINGVATLVGKILPSLFPALSFSEKGCIKVNVDDSHIIVSPDGSCFSTSSGNTSIAVEIKCPFPPIPGSGSYKMPVYYKIPSYYVPQILSEMAALKTETLLFLCFSNESTVVLKAIFDDELWSAIIQELALTYGKHGGRPKRKSDNIHLLRKRIEEYIDKNVEFIGEKLETWMNHIVSILTVALRKWTT